MNQIFHQRVLALLVMPYSTLWFANSPLHVAHSPSHIAQSLYMNYNIKQPDGYDTYKHTHTYSHPHHFQKANPNQYTRNKNKEVEKKLSHASSTGSREGRTLDLGLTYEILGPRANQLSHGTVDSGCGIGVKFAREGWKGGELCLAR